MGEGKKYVICEKELEVYRRDMLENERSRATIEKYIRDVRAFCRWNGEKEIDRLRVLEWKEYLGTCYAVSSANSMLAALNGYFDFRGWEELRVKPFRQQKRIYREPEEDLSREEYMRLIEEAQRQGKERLKLVMQTICATGIRVSELAFSLPGRGKLQK